VVGGADAGLGGDDLDVEPVVVQFFVGNLEVDPGGLELVTHL
jgi:hypothetical protein